MTDELDGRILQIEGGAIRGKIGGSVVRFLGIPYAAPPQRFELPQPPLGWNGVRDMDDPGPAAPHRIRPFPAIDLLPLVGRGSDGRDGDYLRLNIWAPREASAAPVMVFIHGGGFVGGCKDASVHEGAAFAKSGIVCVAINYRMGIDGFLPVPGVPTNLGLRDMLFALAWVQRNIAAFGGNPANVTVFGESAGAMAIADLVTSPLAEGLFARAIIQSGHGAMVREIDVAQRLVKKLAKILRVTPDADGFRTISHAAAMDALDKVAKPWAVDLRDGEGREPVYGISRFIPVHGDDVLPESRLMPLRLRGSEGAGALSWTIFRSISGLPLIAAAQDKVNVGRNVEPIPAHLAQCAAGSHLVRKCANEGRNVNDDPPLGVLILSLAIGPHRTGLVSPASR